MNTKLQRRCELKQTAMMMFYAVHVKSNGREPCVVHLELKKKMERAAWILTHYGFRYFSQS